MPKRYSSEPTRLTEGSIDHDTLANIGRLIRACAELDDMLNLHIRNLGEMSESKATILLGRTSLSRRLEIAEALAAIHSPAAARVHSECFNSLFRETFECRNDVATVSSWDMMINTGWRS